MEKALFPSNNVHSSSSLHVHTDASNLGFGGTFGNKCFFSSEGLSTHISIIEFLSIVIVFEFWGFCLANTTIVKHSDNAAVVHVVNKTTSKNTKRMHLMRRLMILSLPQNKHFRAEHIPAIANTAAD